MPDQQWQSTDEHSPLAPQWQTTDDHSPLISGTPAHLKEVGDNMATIAKGTGDILGGIGASLAKTVGGAASLISKGHDVLTEATNAVLPQSMQRPPVQMPEVVTKRVLPWMKSLAVPPKSPEGKVGEVIGDVIPFLLPGGAVARGAKAIDAVTAGSRFPRLLAGAGKAALEGATAGGVAGVESGGDSTAMEHAAMIGAAVPGVVSATTAAGPILKDSAVKAYSRVMGATKETNKNISAKVVPDLIDRGVMAWTRKGLSNKLNQSAEDASQNLKAGYDALPADATINLPPILADIENAQQKYIVKGTGAIGDPQSYNALEVMKHKLTTDLAPIADKVSVDSARSLRQILDDPVARKGGFAGMPMDDRITLLAKKAGADAIRRQLAKEFPDIAALNAEFSFWKSAEDVLDATLKRTQSHAVPLTHQMGAIMGAASHGVSGLATGVLATKLITSPAWRTVSAVTKSRIAGMISNGQTESLERLAAGILESRQVPKQ